MATDINVAIVRGRIARDIELKTTSNGVEYVNFVVASNDFTPKGEEQRADFLDFKAWRQLAAFIAKYFKKGDAIIVKGRNKSERYEKDGEKKTIKYILAEEVNFAGSKAGGKSDGSGQSNMNGFADANDEENPF